MRTDVSPGTYTEDYNHEKEGQVKSNVNGYTSVGLVPCRTTSFDRHDRVIVLVENGKSCKEDMSSGRTERYSTQRAVQRERSSAPNSEGEYGFFPSS